jgi:hypothetical protein
MHRNSPGTDGKKKLRSYVVVCKVTSFCRKEVRAFSRIEALEQVAEEAPTELLKHAESDKVQLLGAVPTRVTHE